DHGGRTHARRHPTIPLTSLNSRRSHIYSCRVSSHSPSLSSRRVTGAFYQLGVTLGFETDRIDHDYRQALVQP
ncbi:hypothetical protein ACH4PR_38150, partial [Streptomyces mirabilis]|uniref:hypothetical protein n=1 Tax=Streptomyces mirabilis TaxID=68239 RepID=UPI0037B60770